MPRSQEEIQAEHLAGEHFGRPNGTCWICELDDREPEAPDPFFEDAEEESS